MDANVTRGNLKNLVTDKPAPITVALAQLNGVPVLVNPESMLMNNTVADAHIIDGPVIIGIDEVTLLQTKNPVVNPPFNNWSVNQPSVPHDQGLAGDADLGQNIIVDGHRVHFSQ